MKGNKLDMAPALVEFTFLHVEEVDIEQDAYNDMIIVKTNTMTEKVGWYESC